MPRPTDGQASIQMVANKPAAHAPIAFDPPPVMTHSRSLLLAAQLGSYRSAERALAGWHELQSKAPSALAELQPRLESVDLGERGTFYRLKAGPVLSSEALDTLCTQLTDQGISCYNTDFTGQDPA